VATGIGYYLSARLAFGLLTIDKVAVFWPASGLSAGILIARGRRARWPVALGVFIAVFGAHLITAKPLAAGMASALADVAEVLVIAGLIEWFFGRSFQPRPAHSRDWADCRWGLGNFHFCNRRGNCILAAAGTGNAVDPDHDGGLDRIRHHRFPGHGAIGHRARYRLGTAAASQ
jgi:hypothetical protein